MQAFKLPEKQKDPFLGEKIEKQALREFLWRTCPIECPEMALPL